MKRKKTEKFLKKECFQCQKGILVKYNPGTNEYIKKNNWYYWTEKEKNQEKFICSSCLLDLYHERPKEYLKEVENKKKRRILATYIYNGTIS